MSSSDPIYDLIRGYLDIPGVLAAVLVSEEGLVVNAARSDEVDTDMISALVVDTVAKAQHFGEEAGVGKVDTMTIEFEQLTLLLAPFERDLMLALVALPGTFAVSSEALSA